MTPIKMSGEWLFLMPILISIATMDEWKPKKLYCPHCGEHHTSEVYDKWKDRT